LLLAQMSAVVDSVRSLPRSDDGISA
jgi:hypothetical protein